MATIRVECVPRLDRSSTVSAKPTVAANIPVPHRGPGTSAAQSDPTLMTAFQGRRDEPGIAKCWGGDLAVFVATGAPPNALAEPRNLLPANGYIEVPIQDGETISFAEANI